LTDGYGCATQGVVDASVIIAWESGRALRAKHVPSPMAISVVTLGDLHAGVLGARDAEVRAVRLATLESVSDVEVLPIDPTVAAEWARLRAHLAERGRKLNVNALWIAATAAAHRIPVVTQDSDFDPLEGAAGVTIVRV
jgi:predicted nucleic acid-binding protein